MIQLHQSPVAPPNESASRWLLLIHQLPSKPAYLRVKVGRRLARIGAVVLKNSVYVLPRTEAAQEDFEWVLREVTAEGGDATLLDAQLLDGLSDAEVEELSWCYLEFGGLSWMRDAFYGIGAAVIAIIARSVWKLGKAGAAGGTLWTS